MKESITRKTSVEIRILLKRLHIQITHPISTDRLGTGLHFPSPKPLKGLLQKLIFETILKICCKNSIRLLFVPYRIHFTRNPHQILHDARLSIMTNIYIIPNHYHVQNSQPLKSILGQNYMSNILTHYIKTVGFKVYGCLEVFRHNIIRIFHLSIRATLYSTFLTLLHPVYFVVRIT